MCFCFTLMFCLVLFDSLSCMCESLFWTENLMPRESVPPGNTAQPEDPHHRLRRRRERSAAHRNHPSSPGLAACMSTVLVGQAAVVPSRQSAESVDATAGTVCLWRSVKRPAQHLDREPAHQRALMDADLRITATTEQRRRRYILASRRPPWSSSETRGATVVRSRQKEVDYKSGLMHDNDDGATPPRHRWAVAP